MTEVFETETGDLFQGMNAEEFGRALQDITPTELLNLSNKRQRGYTVIKSAELEKKKNLIKRSADQIIAAIEARIKEAEHKQSAESEKLELDRIIQQAKADNKDKVATIKEQERLRREERAEVRRQNKEFYNRFLERIEAIAHETN